MLLWNQTLDIADLQKNALKLVDTFNGSRERFEEV